MANDLLWVKRCPTASGLGIPLIIFTAGRSGQMHYYGEYFILISGRNPAFYGQRTMLDKNKFPSDCEKFMKGELEQQAQTRLSIHYFDLYEKSKNNFYLQNIELVDVDKDDVLRLWMRGEFTQELKIIKNKSISDALKSFLEIVVKHEPPIITTDF